MMKKLHISKKKVEDFSHLIEIYKLHNINYLSLPGMQAMVPFH